MIAIVVPAHNEKVCIRSCLDALREATRRPDLVGEPVELVSMLDACTDATGIHACAAGAAALAIRARNAGMARAG